MAKEMEVKEYEMERVVKDKYRGTEVDRSNMNMLGRLQELRVSSSKRAANAESCS